MRVGIIGCGNIAAVHGPFIAALRNAAIVGIADEDPARAKALANQLKVSRIHQE